MQIALYQPDIPQNMGSILRLCACLDMPCHIIEPCGFVMDDRKLKRVAMDYVDRATLYRHASWEVFLNAARAASWRIVLFSTKAEMPYYAFRFLPDDVLLLGRESAGVPQEVADAAHARLRIPMANKARSLNISQAASMAAGEAMRQLQRNI